MESFTDIQLKLARAIRSGEPTSDFDKRRLNIYQELFFNNIEGFCASAFPVLKSILSSDRFPSKSLPLKPWRNLIRDFFVNGQTDSPYFVDIAESFVGFLNSSESPVVADLVECYPWVLELAHYEWAELYVSNQELPHSIGKEVNIDSHQDRGGVIKFKLASSALPLAYQYPVQALSANFFENIQPTLTTLLVHQDFEGMVKFVSTDVVSIHLLNALQQQSHDFQSLLELMSNPPVSMTLVNARSYVTQALTYYLQNGVLIVDNQK